MIIDFTIEDLLLDSYLQKNFHTPFVSHNRILEVTASIQPSTVEDDEYPYILVSTNGEESFGVPEEELTSGHWITAMYHK